MLYNDLAFLPININFPKSFNIINDFPTNFHFWNFKQLLDDDNKGKYETKTWRKDLNDEYSFVKDLVNQLPFKELSSVRITKQNSSVSSHLDIPQNECPSDIYENFVKNEPCGYRFVLTNKNTFLQFYIKEKWVNANLPNTPCCYLMNTTKLLHRVISFGKISERITVYVRGIVDEKKHIKFMENNLKDFKSSALYF
jgi:hypothetical protein